eukprot:8160897-Lingulodinium_polyedra.AAC.1
MQPGTARTQELQPRVVPAGPLRAPRRVEAQRQELKLGRLHSDGLPDLQLPEARRQSRLLLRVPAARQRGLGG